MHIYGSPEFSNKKDELLHKIREIVKKEYYDRKNNLYDDLFIVGKGVKNIKTNEVYDKVSGEVGEKFDSHGISKTNQLENLLNLLDNGIDENRTFYTAAFELSDEVKNKIASAVGTGGGTAYKDGIGVVVGDYNKSIKDNGIGFVFINDIYGGLIMPLSELYPQFHFHLLSEQKKVLEGASNVNEKLEYKLKQKKS